MKDRDTKEEDIFDILDNLDMRDWFLMGIFSLCMLFATDGFPYPF